MRCRCGNFIAVMYKSYALKTTHDMLHIAADLHRSYDPATAGAGAAE